MLVKPSGTATTDQTAASRCHWNWSEGDEVRCRARAMNFVKWDNGAFGQYCHEHFPRAEEQKPASAESMKAAMGEIRKKLRGIGE